MKKSIQGKTPQEAVSEKSGSGSGDNGFRGVLEGGSEPMTLSEKKMCPVGSKWVYICSLQKAKKLIPACFDKFVRG